MLSTVDKRKDRSTSYPKNQILQQTVGSIIPSLYIGGIEKVLGSPERNLESKAIPRWFGQKGVKGQPGGEPGGNKSLLANLKTGEKRTRHWTCSDRYVNFFVYFMTVNIRESPIPVTIQAIT